MGWTAPFDDSGSPVEPGARFPARRTRWHLRELFTVPSIAALLSVAAALSVVAVFVFWHFRVATKPGLDRADQ